MSQMSFSIENSWGVKLTGAGKVEIMYRASVDGPVQTLEMDPLTAHRIASAILFQLKQWEWTEEE